MPISTVGSGLDVPGMSKALADADIKVELARLSSQSKSVNTQLSAMGQLKSLIDGLQASLTNMITSDQFYSLKATVSDGDYLSVTTSSTAAAGQYQVQIDTLAQNHTLASSPFADTTSSIGNGTITINFGSYSPDKSVFTPNADKPGKTITISAGNDSLTAVRDAINNSDSGVTATIVTDSQGPRLTLTSKDSGSNSALQVIINDNDGNNTDSSGLSALAYDPTTAVENSTEKVAAVDSVIYLNGIKLTNSSNTLSNVIDGLTLNLKKVTAGTNINVGVDYNKSQVTNLINDFIQKYNATANMLNMLTGYNPDTKSSGILQGDATLRTFRQSLSNLIGNVVDGLSGNLLSLADIGLTTDKQGLLTLDQTKYNDALNNHFSEIAGLFAKTVKTSDSSVSVASIDKSVKAGSYSIYLSELTPGTSMSGTIGGITANSSDGLSLRGSGNLLGLKLNIYGSATGSRGTVTVSDGIATQLNDLLDSYLDTNGGLTVKTKILEQNNRSLQDANDKLEAKHEMLYKRYLSTFSKLDKTLIELQATSDFLTQQLASLPKLTINRG